MNIAQSKIKRWHFLKQANAINAGSIARYICKQTGIEIYGVYANLFYDLRELLNSSQDLNVRQVAQKTHDLACRQLLSSIRSDLGNEAYTTCKDCLFTFNNQ